MHSMYNIHTCHIIYVNQLVGLHGIQISFSIGMSGCMCRLRGNLLSQNLAFLAEIDVFGHQKTCSVK